MSFVLVGITWIICQIVGCSNLMSKELYFLKTTELKTTPENLFYCINNPDLLRKRLKNVNNPNMKDIG